MSPNCPRCQSDAAIKSVVVQGRQRYKYKQCHYFFRCLKPLTEPLERKRKVVQIHCSGVSIRQTAKLEGISQMTARRWVRDFAKNQLPARPEPAEPVSVVELDEMWHYPQTSSGSGKRSDIRKENCWIGKSELGMKKLQASF